MFKNNTVKKYLFYIIIGETIDIVWLKGYNSCESNSCARNYFFKGGKNAINFKMYQYYQPSIGNVQGCQCKK